MPRPAFLPALLGGLVELGPLEPSSGDLSLELGLSVWLRRSDTSLLQARAALLEIRPLIMRVACLDPAGEPVPLVGGSPRADVVNLVAYLDDLLRRASAGLGLQPQPGWSGGSSSSCPSERTRTRRSGA